MKLYTLRIYMQTYMKQITIPDNVLSSTPAKCPLNAEISKGSHRLLSFPDSETSLATGASVAMETRRCCFGKQRVPSKWLV